MPYNFVTNIETCYSNVPPILYYSHIPTASVALLLGIFVFINNKKSTATRLLLLVSIIFSLWSISDIVIFISPNSSMVMFFWAIINLLEITASITTLYFAYIFLNEEKDPPFLYKLLFGAILLSFAVFVPLQINLQGFDIVNCESIQGPLVNYFYVIEIFNFICLFTYCFFKVIKTSLIERRKALLFSMGVVLFSASFSGANLIASFSALIDPSNPNNWAILQYGLFGMPIFMAFLVYLIVRFKTFNVKLLATQALVWGLTILIGAQFFFIKSTVNFILNAVTFVASLFFGQLLIESVKHEVEQKEYLQTLNTELKGLLQQRESLVHLITHKVKGSFTRSKYLFAEMLQGTFGQLSPELAKMTQKGLDSDIEGIATVDLVLNAANLQNGNVKYDLKKTDFKDILVKLIEEKKLVAEGRGLQMESSIEEGDYNMMGDAFWLKEVIINLLENSIRYTRVGKINVSLSQKDHKILFVVKDTGVGITAEDKKNLFTEGGRGKDSVKVNVDSTGYGLYSVKLIVEAHKGKIWVESEGANKGSTFSIEFDALDA